MSLPAFLLAWADSKHPWLGLKKYAVPAVNARWSVTRVLFLTAVNAVVGILLAWVISLLTAGRLLGWLASVLGLFMACQGAVWYGLIALCWNQRVARLERDPNLPTGPGRARFVVLRWGLGLFYFLLVAVTTPLALLLTILNIYGELAWRRERAGLAAQGERLSLREIIGPEVAAAENAWAAPVFAPLFDLQPARVRSILAPTELRPEASNIVAKMEELLWLPEAYLPKMANNTNISPKENLAHWSAAYRTAVARPAKNAPSWVGGLELPQPGNPARDVLAGLSASDTLVAEICAAAARPRAQVPLRLDQGVPFAMTHLRFLKSVQRNLSLRCVAHLGAGEIDAAFVVATNAINVAELLREEPLLIDQLVRGAQGTTVIRTLWQGLAEHQWTDAQLAVFQEQLGRLDYLPSLTRAIEGERAFGLQSMEELIAGVSWSDESSGAFRRMVIIIPLGLLRVNQAALARMCTTILVDLRGRLDQTPRVGLAGLSKTWEKSPDAEPFSPFTFTARALRPAFAKLIPRVARAHTTVQLAITACALERYYLAHGNYPAKLDELVPTFLRAPAIDPMTGQPFHYHRTPDGWFLLYSVGEDGKDDGGVARTNAKEPLRDWPWPVPTRPETWGLF